MNQDECFAFAQAAGSRAVTTVGRIGYLRLTQYYRRGNHEHKLREPELLIAVGQEAEARHIPYGVEVPTSRRYRFTTVVGTRRRRARHDVVLFGPEEGDVLPRVRMELKEGSPGTRRNQGEATDVPAISKDFEKLLLEPSADGRCMFHILQAADRHTVPALLKKYRLAHCAALDRIMAYGRATVAPATPTWFSLAILTPRLREPGGFRPALWHLRLAAGP
jgi:hypothetical protein